MPKTTPEQQEWGKALGLPWNCSYHPSTLDFAYAPDLFRHIHYVVYASVFFAQGNSSELHFHKPACSPSSEVQMQEKPHTGEITINVTKNILFA